MRVLSLLFLLPLVLATPVPDQDAADDVDVAYVTGIVESLFGREGRDMDDEEDAENTLEEGEEEEKSMSNLVKEDNPVEIERFNAYMDAIYRRMNAALRAKLMDPMELNLNKKEKRTAKALEEEDEDTEDVEVDRMGKAEDKMNKKNKKTKLSAEERAAKKAERKSQNKKDKEEKKKEKTPTKKGKKSGKGKNKNKNKGNKKNNKGKGKKKEEKEEEKEEVGLAREKRNNDKKHHHNNKKGANGANHHGKHGKGKKGNKGGNKNGKGGKKAARTNDVSKGKTMGALSGIATLRRSGDVEVMNAEGHVIVKSQFSVGPLQLEVSKSNGNGKDRSVKTAKAITEKLAGKMILKVKTDGSAHVKTVVFQKPEGVNVQGSLGGKQARSDKYLENSLKSIRPVAAQRVLKMARYVLKSPSTVERS